MDQSGSTGSEAPQVPQTPAPAEPAPTTQWAPPPPPVQAGPAGFVYADVPNRAIAYIIDSIIVGIIAGIVGVLLAGFGLTPVSIEPGTLVVTVNYLAVIVSAIVGLVIGFAYFIYMWTAQRGTVGMKVLGMQVGNAGDGRTMTTNQAVRRAIAISGPSVLSQALYPIPAIGPLLVLFAFLWFCYLLYSTWKSPTKQGFHDVFANTMVVKATRAAG
jgi:uncharacterized RDD family membrane protein YckC